MTFVVRNLLSSSDPSDGRIAVGGLQATRPVTAPLPPAGVGGTRPVAQALPQLRDAYTDAAPRFTVGPPRGSR